MCIRDRRIAFSSDAPLGTEVHPDCVNAVLDAASLCSALGHEVVEASPPVESEALWKTFTTIMSAGISWSVADWSRRLGREPSEGDLEPFVASFAAKGKSVSGGEYLLQIQSMHSLSRTIGQFYEHFDMWLTPVLGKPPLPLGELAYSGGDPFEHRRKTAEFAPFTYIRTMPGTPGVV